MFYNTFCFSGRVRAWPKRKNRGPRTHIFRKAPARQAAGGLTGSPSGEELEGESPRGGDMVKADGKAPYPFGLIFEKKVVLKSNLKNNGGEKGFMSDFCELWGPKGGQSGCFGITFGTFFGDCLDYG